MSKKHDLRINLKKAARRRARRPEPKIDPADKQIGYDAIASAVLACYGEGNIDDRQLEAALRGLIAGRTHDRSAGEQICDKIKTSLETKHVSASQAQSAAQRMLKDVLHQRELDDKPTAFLEFLATVCR